MFSYIMDVLLPECVIRLLMETHDIDYNAVSLFGYIVTLYWGCLSEPLLNPQSSCTICIII